MTGRMRLQPSFGHLREPVLLEANLLRGLALPIPDGNSLLNTLEAMGQKLFYSPATQATFRPPMVQPVTSRCPNLKLFLHKPRRTV